MKWVRNLLLGVMLAMPTVVASFPQGIYSLDVPVDAPYVDGMVVRLKWADAEPTYGQYNFSEIDQAFTNLPEGQSITLATLFVLPDWVKAEVPTFINGNHEHGIPWDYTLWVYSTEYIQALANHVLPDGIRLADHPKLANVSSAIFGINGLRMFTVPEGYTVRTMRAAITQSFFTWQVFFPNKERYAGIFNISGHSEDVVELLSLWRNYQVAPFQEFLTGQAPMSGTFMADIADTSQDPELSTAYQACGAWTDQDGRWAQCNWVEPLDTPALGIAHGTSLGGTYFEFYANDLINPDYIDMY